MNKLFKNVSLALVAGAAALPAAAAQEGVVVDNLGVNNTLVRVSGDGKYLLLPVQEANDEAKVNVLKDGKLDKTLNVRLAKTKVDYYVPFLLEPYKGHDLVLNVITHQSRSSVREAKDDAAWKTITVADEYVPKTDKFRPAFHHAPQWGWMNDPNGMVYKDGVWHLYYQWNPYGSKWQNLSWGHATSTDLINWELQPKALEPDGLGMIFSGSSVLDPKNTAGFGEDAIVSIYTSADASQIQSLAYSLDNGQTFTTLPSNPVITLDSEARDPNMFWNEATGEWNLLLAHALDHEMLVFTSPDLKTWTLASAFGKGLGAQEGVWECPDLFELDIVDAKGKPSGKKKWMLICNLNPGGPFGGSAAQYFIGDFDGKTFKADTDSKGDVITKWMDFGKDHYATVSFSDTPGRRTVIGWMSNWQYAPEVPTQQFRSANTLPRDLSLFKGADGQIYVRTLPSPELLALRGDLTVDAPKFSLDNSSREFKLPEANDGICEVLVTLDAKKAQNVSLTFANDKDEKVVMVYDPKAATLSFDRTQSGITDFSNDFPAVTVAPTFNTKGQLSLRIFIDRASFEVFGNDGKFAMTNLVFPNSPYSTLTVAAAGKADISNVDIYAVTPAK